MQWVMPIEARAGRVVDGLVGNRLGRVAPTPFLSEKLREGPRVNAARVADVHDVAPRLGHRQHGPLVDGERSGSLLARGARRAVLDAPREVALEAVVTLRWRLILLT